MNGYYPYLFLSIQYKKLIDFVSKRFHDICAECIINEEHPDVSLARSA